MQVFCEEYFVESPRIKERSSEAIFIVDDKDIVIRCNTAAEHIFGWHHDDMIGGVFSDLFLPEDARKQFDLLLQTLEEEGSKDFLVNGIEQNALHRDGYEFPVKFNIFLIEKQCPCSFIITIRDMRERTQQLQVLHQASQNQQIVNSILKIALEDFSLDAILLHALEAILLLNTPNLLNKGAILLVDEESDYLVLKAQKGFSEQQIEACSRIPFGTCHCGRAALTSEIQFAECVDDKHDIRSDDITPHGHYCIPICSNDNILGVISLYVEEGHVQNDDEQVVLRAITNILAGVIERKKIEIQRYLLIKKQEAMITRVCDEKKLTDSIIHSLNAGLMVFDLDGNIVTLNPSGRSILSQFVGRDVSGSDDLEKFAKIPVVRFMQKTQSQQTEKTHEISWVNIRGEEKTLQYTVVPLDNSSSRQIGVILLFSDITETLRIQREMENMNRLSTVAEIASAVAHEVRNPLAGIKTMSQAIEENCDEDDENREYITRIIKQVDRLNGLLTEFFTYARPGEAKKVKISMAYIVSEIRHLLKLKLDSKRIVLEEEYAEGLPDIYVDPDQMHQVFLNLMLNAIDAMGNNGKIQISARLAGREEMKNYTDQFLDLKKNIDYVAVCFRDNGKGMSAEVAEKAFEPFYSTKPQGSGLGLAIVHRILAANNAFIMIDSSHEKGIAFQMMFESVYG
jgi:PAS domain S-box-containing protein